MNTSRSQYEKPSYTPIFEMKISDTLQIAVKKQNGTDEKFFDIRRKNDKGRFSVSGIFLIVSEFETFREAMKQLPAPGMSKTFTFCSGRILQVEAKDDFITFSATRDKTKRPPATINVGVDEVAIISLVLPTVAEWLYQ